MRSSASTHLLCCICLSTYLPTCLQAINRHTEAEMQYTGVMDAVKRMLADEGVAGFYKGERWRLLPSGLDDLLCL